MFADIIGQEKVKKHLIDSAKSGRVPHAQLFCGKEGTGKLGLAIAYAQYLSCEHPTDSDSCGVCPSCLKFRNLAHPDLHFVFPIVKKDNETCDDYLKQFRECVTKDHYLTNSTWLNEISNETKKGKIYDSESDKIIKKLSMKSYEGGYKFMIIWQPESMDVGTANKILKIIEEPPAKTLMILVSNEPDRIIGTILSRTQKVNVPPVERDKIESYVKEQYQESDDDAKYIARVAAGSIVAARNAAESNSANKQHFEDFKFLMRTTWGIRNFSTLDKKGDALIDLRKFAETMAKNSRNHQIEFLQYAQRMIRENFIYNFHNEDLNYLAPFEKDFSKKFSPFINEGNVIGISTCLGEAEKSIAQNGQSKIIFTDLALKMIMLLKTN